MIPALIRKMVEAQRARRRARSCSGATARRRASSCTSTTAPRGSLLAAERYDGAEPVNLGTGEEISIRDLAELVRAATGYDGRDPLGHVASRTASRAASSTRRAPSSAFGFRRARAAARRDRAHRRLVPQRPRRRVSVAAVGTRVARPALGALDRAIARPRRDAGRARADADRGDGAVRAARGDPQRVGLVPGRRPDLVHERRVARSVTARCPPATSRHGWAIAADPRGRGSPAARSCSSCR